MSRASARLLHGNGGRTNGDWLAGLRGDDVLGLKVQEDLRGYIRRGLGGAFGRQEDLDDAALEDLTQEAMVRITTRLDDFRGESKFTTWAMAIAIRVAYTALRRRRWGDRSLEDLGLSVDSQSSPIGSPSTDPTDPTSRSDLLCSLREAIDRDLTPRQRAAVLGELAGMPTAVLEEQLNTNVNALYKLHHDARLRLRAALEQRGFSETDVRGILHAASNG